MNSWPAGKLLVAAHDAGGAEVISSWLRKAGGGYRQVDVLAEGPAVKIFQAKLTEVVSLSRECALARLADYDQVLTGTSWGSDLEMKVRAAAKAAGVKVAVYLDHWINYRERFLQGGTMILPDEVWVGDEHAFRLATETIPSASIKLVPNQYFVDAVTAIRAAPAPPPGRGKRILYVCEPRTMHHGQTDYWGYTEYEALGGYLDYLGRQAVTIEEVRIRLHPAENTGKYAAVTGRFSSSIPIAESCGGPLAIDCAWADWVVGCDSMAMVIALLAGRKVFSCIPPQGRKMTLPYQEIVKLFRN